MVQGDDRTGRGGGARRYREKKHFRIGSLQVRLPMGFTGCFSRHELGRGPWHADRTKVNSYSALDSRQAELPWENSSSLTLDIAWKVG